MLRQRAACSSPHSNVVFSVEREAREADKPAVFSNGVCSQSGARLATVDLRAAARARPHSHRRCKEENGTDPQENGFT